MKTAGQILRQARERRKLSLAHIASATHIEHSCLEAIEADMYASISNEVSVRGFLTLFAREVGLDPQSVVALYRRDAKPPQSRGVLAQFVVWNRRALFRSLSGAFVLGACLGVLVFAGALVARLRDAPPLQVSSPKESARVNSPFILRGQTSSDAVVRIDGEPVGVDQDGFFQYEQNVSPGLHVISVRSRGRNGKERVVQRTITVNGL